MGSGSMVVTGAELSLLQEEINTAIEGIWKRLDKLEAASKPKKAPAKTPKKDEKEDDIAFEVK